MQKKDIKVGEHYAYQSHKWATAQRVEVVSLEGKVRQGYSFNQRTVNGITVKRTDGPQKDREFTITGRNLAHTWAEEERLRKQAEEHRRLSNEAQAKTAATRANLAKRIDLRLAGHGEAPRPVMIWNDHNFLALEAAGFEVVPREEGENRTREVVMARFEVDDFMRHFKVDGKVAEILLADAEAPKGLLPYREGR